MEGGPSSYALEVAIQLVLASQKGFRLRFNTARHIRRQNLSSVSYLSPWRLPRGEMTAAEGPRVGNPPHRGGSSASAHPRPRPPTIAPVSHSWIFSSISLCGRRRGRSPSVGLSPLEPRIEAPPPPPRLSVRPRRGDALRAVRARTYFPASLLLTLSLTTCRGCIIPTVELLRPLRTLHSGHARQGKPFSGNSRKKSINSYEIIARMPFIRQWYGSKTFIQRSPLRWIEPFGFSLTAL